MGIRSMLYSVAVDLLRGLLSVDITQLMAGPWQDRGVMSEHLLSYVFNKSKMKNKEFYNL